MRPLTRATKQNAAIDAADKALRAEDMPTYTDAILALDALASATEDHETNDARTAAIDIVMRATGPKGVMPAFWMQRFGRIRRQRSPREVALEICPEAQFADVNAAHLQIRVPAEHIEAVRAAVEPRRTIGCTIEYLPLETNK